MTIEELIEKGNEAVNDALRDSIIIINSKGNVLTKKRHSDEMAFSPKLDCTDDCSAILFDTEDAAAKAIDGVLFPQDDGETYTAVKITKYNPETDKDDVIFPDSDGEMKVDSEEDDILNVGKDNEEKKDDEEG